MLGKAMKKMWGCDGPSTSLIDIGFGEKPIDRCPIALFRDSQDSATFATWASAAAGSFQSGNMAWFMDGAQMSVAGEAAFDLYSSADSKKWDTGD